MASSVTHLTRAISVAVLATVASGPAAGAKPDFLAEDLVPVGEMTIAVVAETPTTIYQVGFEASNSGSFGGGGGGAGVVSAEKIILLRKPDAISAELFRAVVTGLNLPGARIDVYAPGTTTVQSSYILTSVLVTALTNNDGVEGVELDFAQVELSSGGQSFCFDFQTNTSC